MAIHDDVYLVHKKASGEDIWGYAGSSLIGASVAYGINRGIFKNRDKLSNILATLTGMGVGAAGYGVYAANKTKQNATAPELKTSEQLANTGAPTNNPDIKRIQAIKTWNDPGFRGAIDVAAGAAGAAAGHTIIPDIIEDRAKAKMVAAVKSRDIPKPIDNKIIGLQDRIGKGFDNLAAAETVRAKIEAIQRADKSLTTPAAAIAAQDKSIFGIQDRIGADQNALKALNARVDALKSNAQRRAQYMAAKGTSGFTTPRGRKIMGVAGGAAGVGFAELVQQIVRERLNKE